MKRGNIIIIFVCFILVFTAIPVNATMDLTVIDEKEVLLIQPKFTNISFFYDYFYLTDQGKAVLISSIDARNVDECRISMHLQKHQNGSGVNVNHWSVS